LLSLSGLFVHLLGIFGSANLTIEAMSLESITDIFGRQGIHRNLNGANRSNEHLRKAKISSDCDSYLPQVPVAANGKYAENLAEKLENLAKYHLGCNS
jgi:hypothetical protein